MKFNDLINAVQADLPISRRHEEWLEHDSIYTPQALKFAQDVLSHDVGGSRRRSTSFRGSSLHECQRKLILRTTKVSRSKREISTKLRNIFNTGHFLHLKWQMAGLSAGWLEKAEIPYQDLRLDFGGTLDGILWDGSLFEFKSINDYGYKSVLSYGPKTEHLLQATSYMHLAHLSHCSFVYENKNTGEWKEFRVAKDEKIVTEILDNLQHLNELKMYKRLPEPLEKCIDKEGPYTQCEFNKVCLQLREWPE